MNIPVFGVLGSQGRVVNDQQVFRVVFFRLLREIERAGQNGMTVDNNYFVVSDRMPVVDESRDAVVLRESRRGVFVGLVALVQNHLYVHAPLVCVRESLGDWRGREGVGLNEHRRSGFGQRINDGLGAPAFRREVNLDTGSRGGNRVDF